MGTAYFKQHATGFDTNSPATYYQSLSEQNITVQEQHSIWLDNIRQNIWDRVKFENEMIPSDDALLLHWKRSCWVLHMWQQSDQPIMTLENYGWGIIGNELTIKWDTATNVQAVRDRVDSLLKGCKCSTGCLTGRCGCKKKGKHCSIGCECLNCGNNVAAESKQKEAHILSVEAGRLIDREGEDIVDWVFGQNTGIDSQTSQSESEPESDED